MAASSVLDSEDVPLGEAAGRVLAMNVRAGFDVPPFDRAAMDGYAVRGEETFGADPYTPASFRVVGRSRPGRRFGGQVLCGEAVEIATGAPIPSGADTVVPVEATRLEGRFRSSRGSHSSGTPRGPARGGPASWRRRTSDRVELFDRKTWGC